MVRPGIELIIFDLDGTLKEDIKKAGPHYMIDEFSKLKDIIV